MSSIKNQIIAAVFSTLQTVPGVQGAYRSRPEAMRREESPAIVVEPVTNLPNYDGLNFMNWAFTFRVTVIVRGAIPDEISDPIEVEIYNRLMADRTVGGLCLDLLPGEQRTDIIEGDRPAGVMQGLWIATHRTSQTALDA